MKIESSGKLSQKIAVLAEKALAAVSLPPFYHPYGRRHPAFREISRYYMLQDYLYLRDYTKILAAILQKADTFEQIRFFER